MDGFVETRAGFFRWLPGADAIQKGRLHLLARRAAYVVIVESFVIWAFAVFHGSRVWLVHQLPDDAYYYLEIARRIALGQGATFDGVTRTDGFHPLWELVLAGLAVIWSGDALIRAALLGPVFKKRQSR